MNTVNTLRLTGLFKGPVPPVTIIGCGAIGSRLAVELTKLGVPSFTLYDDDTVSSHNICNQAFTNAQVGMSKVTATKELIMANGCSDVAIAEEKFTNQFASGIVFLCVDSMSARKNIMKHLLRDMLHVTRVIETRMGIDEVRCYDVDRQRYNLWLSRSDYGDEHVEVSACGTSLAVGATAGLISSIATWMFMKPIMEKARDFEVIMSTDGFSVYVETP